MHVQRGAKRGACVCVSSVWSKSFIIIARKHNMSIKTIDMIWKHLIIAQKQNVHHKNIISECSSHFFSCTDERCLCSNSKFACTFLINIIC